MLKKKGIYIVSILIILLVIIISFSKANYKQIIQGNGVVSIAKPIVEIKTGNKILKEAYNGMESIDFNFDVQNYKEELISELDFEYVISIKEMEKNFPIEYVLLDEKGSKIPLKNNTSSKILLKGNEKEKHSYTLRANWKSKLGNLSASDNIKIEVEAVQKINRK